MIKSLTHQRSRSRITDNGRLYWKETTLFLWLKGKRETQSTHTFCTEEWVDRFEIIDKIMPKIRQNS